MTHLYEFENEGPLLQRTNYFDSHEAQCGEFYLSWNAGVARLLVPDNQKSLLPEMRATHVEIEIIQDGLQIVFDDGSQTPFAIIIANEQCDRLLTIADKGQSCYLSVYIRLGEKYKFKSVII